MLLRYAFLAAVAFSVAGIAEAQAQSPFPPVGQEQNSSPFPPVGQQPSPFPPAGQSSIPQIGGPQFGGPQQSRPQQQEKPPCYDDFMPLRAEVDKRFEATKAAIARKGTAVELCNLLTKFTQAETKMIKYVQQNGAACNLPAGLLDTIKSSNVKSEGYRKQACTAAAAPPRPARPAEPTLSDAFGAPVLNKNNTRTGGGTFDSLSGNPLAR
jgi:hypothetical protein